LLRYKHNYNQVKDFDAINNTFIFLCFVLKSSIIAYFVYELFYKFNWAYLTDIFLVLLLITITRITFKVSSDIEKISNKTKKLIEDYILCNGFKNNSADFNRSCQSFNSILLSKPLNLTILGFKSISLSTFLFLLFFFLTKSSELAGLIQYFKSVTVNNSNSTDRIAQNCTDSVAKQ